MSQKVSKVLVTDSVDEPIESIALRSVHEEAITSIAPDIITTDDSQETTEAISTERIPKPILWRLFISHVLSTWNSRSFEFAATLFLATIFNDTLRPLSIYALARSASAIFLAPAIGRAVDRNPRLPVVRVSIIFGRISVALSCIGFWALTTYLKHDSSLKYGVFAVLIILSCVEKPASTLNLLAIERDWVIEIAGGNEPELQKLNARMRRIDLFCKLVGPLFIALVNGGSTTVAIFLMLGLNIVSLPVEYFAIAQVYKIVPRLAGPKSTPQQNQGTLPRRSKLINFIRTTPSSISTLLTSYYNSPVFLPSFALSLLYFTVLSLGGQMITYLLYTGYSSFLIALVRTLATVLELSATWIAPRAMAYRGSVRAGIWFLSWQALFLAPGIAFLWDENRAIVAASGLVACTVLSRVGLWGYDLCAQFIIQERVPLDQRGAFSSTEAALQNLFELLSYVTTIVWARPAQFKYPVLLSGVAVYTAAALFAVFVRQQRGHLIHLPDVERVKRCWF